MLAAAVSVAVRRRAGVSRIGIGVGARFRRSPGTGGKEEKQGEEWQQSHIPCYAGGGELLPWLSQLPVIAATATTTIYPLDLPSG